MRAASVAKAQAALRANHIALTVLDWGLDRGGAEVLQDAHAVRVGLSAAY